MSDTDENQSFKEEYAGFPVVFSQEIERDLEQPEAFATRILDQLLLSDDKQSG